MSPDHKVLYMGELQILSTFRKTWSGKKFGVITQFSTRLKTLSETSKIDQNPNRPPLAHFLQK